jgi:hypothetical protein
VYNKLFTKILDSSIWLETDSTRIVWLTLIAAMDETGFVQFASVANLAHRARVPEDAAVQAVQRLESPDKNSSDPDHEGRRIERVPGGWMILNAEKYRELVTRAIAQEKTRQRVARFRAKQHAVTNGNGDVTLCNESVTPSEAVSGAEAKTSKTVARASAPLPDSEWLTALENDPAYNGISVATEIAKCRVWASTNRKPFSRRRILAWLNRVEKPVGYNGQHQFAGGFAPNVEVLVEPEPKGWREEFPDFLDVQRPWADIDASSRAHICKTMAKG